MAAAEFERLHGIALARLLCGPAGREVKVEMRPDEGWTSVVPARGPAVVIRHRPRPRRSGKIAGGRMWGFTFTQDQIDCLRRLAKNGRLRLVLVCGSGSRDPVGPEIALLEVKDVARVLDLASFLEQRLTVQAQPRKELWVLRGSVRVKIPRARFRAPNSSKAN
jgi:hypothetical protein